MKKQPLNLKIKKINVLDGYMQIPYRIARSKVLTPSAKLVYGCMLYFIRPKGGGRCYAKKKTISKLSGLSVKTIELTLKQLREMGLISIV